MTEQLSRSNILTCLKEGNVNYDDIVFLREVERLWTGFPEGEILTPETISSIQPEYGDFACVRDLSSLIYIKPELDSYFREEQEKVIILFQGASTAGKDTLLRRLEHSFPGDMETLVTVTTKKPEPSLDPAERYQYVSEEEFRQMVDEGSFIEFAVLPHASFGTMIEMVEQQSASENGVKIMRVEPNGAKKIKAWLEHRNQRSGHEIPTLEVFLLPQISLGQLKDRIARSRPADEVDGRFKRAKLELLMGGCADVVILNPFDETGYPRGATKALYELIKGITGIEGRETDFQDEDLWRELITGVRPFTDNSH